VRISVYVPLAVSAVLAVLAPRLAHRLPPRRAAWALACAALVTTAGWLGALALLAFTALARIPEIARQGAWSAAVLSAAEPVRLFVGVAGAAGLLAACTGLAVSCVRQVRAASRIRRECARLPGDAELVVLDDASPEAFALPGGLRAPGRIVVSRSMLSCLDGREREALLAHERAHLRGRHHLFQAVWRLSAAANPMLRPLAGSGCYVLERWADEDAADRVGDRTVVARAVARAALAASGTPRRSLAATGGAVPRRVRALLAPPPRQRRLPLPLLAGGLLLALCCGSLADATMDNEEILDAAMYAACAPPLGAPPPMTIPPGDQAGYQAGDQPVMSRWRRSAVARPKAGSLMCVSNSRTWTVLPRRPSRKALNSVPSTTGSW
jgi:hypothetical protein